MTRVAVCLSGCGYLDGAEIREAVLTLLSLDRAGVEVQCCAPDVEQMHVVDHRTGEEVPGASRNVLAESARIARGEIVPVEDLDLDLVDALVFPGGFGVAKNLCDFAVRGADCTVRPDIAELIRRARAAGKPMGFVCIAPALAARVLGESEPVELTIGDDAGTAEALEAMGAKHVACAVDRSHEDHERKIVSTPAYMCDAPIGKIADGIDEMVGRLLALLPSTVSPSA